jgi:acyl-CoA thioester hydrolase
MAEPLALTDRAIFPLWVRETTRYCDTDRQGHVNNAVFATFCETGRAAFLMDPAAPLAPPGCAFVIARLELDFRLELGWRQEVDIGTGVIEIGRSSFHLGQGLFRGADCAATARTVIVLMDEAIRRSTPLPDPLRATLRAASFARGNEVP